MEYNQFANEYEQKYSMRMDKKMKGKPQPVKIIMSRTFNSAVMILQAIAGIPFGELTFTIYDFCLDVQFREIVRLYDAELELAGIDPEKFIFDLHPFYNRVSSKIKKENKYREFAEFMGTVIRLSQEKRTFYRERIIGAYLSLVYQTIEYLREDKFDLSTCAYGVSTEGKLLMGSYPLAYFDLPTLELKEAKQKGRIFSNILDERKFVIESYQKRGIIIRGYDDIEELSQIQRIHTAVSTAIFPFINEYTFDIVPINYYHSQDPPLQNMIARRYNIDSLKNRLQHRNATLPTNGVWFEVTDESGEIIGVLLREVVYHDSIYMLYRMDTNKGSLSGYYDTKEKFLFSAIQDNADTPFSNLCKMILSMYASQVLTDMPIEDLNKRFTQFGYPLTIKAFNKGGKLKNQYIRERGAGSSRNEEDYNKEERYINVMIRNLPEGHQASEEARQLAAQYGYDLKPEQTFVRPFIRQVFVKKTDESQ